MASTLTALSPLDGRYAKSADPLRAFFSEHALIGYRVRVELAWLMALAAEPAIAELKPFSRGTVASLNELTLKFNETDSSQIKAIEAAGGLVVAAASLVDRSGGTVALGVPFVPLIRIDVPTYAADAVPPALANIPAIKPGSRAA